MQEEINPWLEYYPRRMSDGLVKDCIANSQWKGVILVTSRSLKDWWKKRGNNSSDRYRWIKVPIGRALVYCTKSQFPSYDDGGPFYSLPGESAEYLDNPTRIEHSHYYTHSPFIKGEREIIEDTYYGKKCNFCGSHSEIRDGWYDDYKCLPCKCHVVKCRDCDKWFRINCHYPERFRGAVCAKNLTPRKRKTADFYLRDKAYTHSPYVKGEDYVPSRYCMVCGVTLEESDLSDDEGPSHNHIHGSCCAVKCQTCFQWFPVRGNQHFLFDRAICPKDKIYKRR